MSTTAEGLLGCLYTLSFAINLSMSNPQLAEARSPLRPVLEESLDIRALNFLHIKMVVMINKARSIAPKWVSATGITEFEDKSVYLSSSYQKPSLLLSSISFPRSEKASAYAYGLVLTSS